MISSGPISYMYCIISWPATIVRSITVTEAINSTDLRYDDVEILGYACALYTVLYAAFSNIACDIRYFKVCVYLNNIKFKSVILIKGVDVTEWVSALPQFMHDMKTSVFDWCPRIHPCLPQSDSTLSGNSLLAHYWRSRCIDALRAAWWSLLVRFHMGII